MPTIVLHYEFRAVKDRNTLWTTWVERPRNTNEAAIEPKTWGDFAMVEILIRPVVVLPVLPQFPGWEAPTGPTSYHFEGSRPIETGVVQRFVGKWICTRQSGGMTKRIVPGKVSKDDLAIIQFTNMEKMYIPIRHLRATSKETEVTVGPNNVFRGFYDSL